MLLLCGSTVIILLHKVYIKTTSCFAMLDYFTGCIIVFPYLIRMLRTFFIFLHLGLYPSISIFMRRSCDYVATWSLLAILYCKAIGGCEVKSLLMKLIY